MDDSGVNTFDLFCFVDFKYQGRDLGYLPRCFRIPFDLDLWQCTHE